MVSLSNKRYFILWVILFIFFVLLDSVMAWQLEEFIWPTQSPFFGIVRQIVLLSIELSCAVSENGALSGRILSTCVGLSSSAYSLQSQTTILHGLHIRWQRLCLDLRVSWPLRSEFLNAFFSECSIRLTKMFVLLTENK